MARLEDRLASLRSRNAHLEKGLERERAAREKGEKEVSWWGGGHMGEGERRGKKEVIPCERATEGGLGVGWRVHALRLWNTGWREGGAEGWGLGPEEMQAPAFHPSAGGALPGTAE